MATEATSQNLDFFRIACEATAYHACQLIRLTGREPSPIEVVEMLTSAPRNLDDPLDPEFHRDSYCCNCMAQAKRALEDEGTPEDKLAWDAASRHFWVTIRDLSPASRHLLESAFQGLYGSMDPRLLVRGE